MHGTRADAVRRNVLGRGAHGVSCRADTKKARPPPARGPGGSRVCPGQLVRSGAHDPVRLSTGEPHMHAHIHICMRTVGMVRFIRSCSSSLTKTKKARTDRTAGRSRL